ncbi:hypothetical protein GCM10007028_27000 [Algibacter mikhailovii]|uniref:CBM6 domain-containing protein n=2 Tax=Algibacter mikhailovii TaxID=425498 RepID=A0A918R6V0_9FLAO|nr:hypothetical protein GCM10007028_27000 [Algibacter mikhailovii]
MAQLDTNIEAETTTFTGNYEVKNNANASGGTFIALKNTSSLAFSANGIPEAGLYRLEVYHFNGGKAQDITLKVNGSSSTVTLQPSNWAFEGAAQVTSLEVNLNAGSNTIKLEYLNVSISLDYFKITQEIINVPDPNPNPLLSDIYYISNDGNDDNDGLSESSSWKTLDRVSQALANNSGSGWVLPGNKILFKRGDTFYGHLIVNRSGTTDELIEISSYGDVNDEYPIISGSGGDITGGDYFEAITLTNSSNLLITKIWVKNDRKDGSRYTYGEETSFGIKVVANKWGGVTSNLIFRDVKVSDVFGVTIPPPSEFNSLKATGIRFESEENEPDLDVAITDVLIEDSYFTHIGKAGVWAIHKGNTDEADDAINRNQNFVIKNNTFFQTGGSGVILSKVHKALVENNDFDHTGYSDGVEGRLAGRGSGMWVWSCRNVVAQYNRSYSIRGPGDSYGMHMDFNNKNIIFQYNYSEDSEGGFCEILGNNYNSVYRFNVSMNDGFRDFHGYTLWISGYVGTGKPAVRSDENYIYNNTIFLNNSIYTPRISIYALNTYVYNNIFVASNGATIGYDSVSDPSGKPGVSIDVGSGSFIMENNLLEGDIHDDFTSFGTNSVTGSPVFVNEGGQIKEDYILQFGSPAIDKGKSFPEPSFPLAGSGIFSDISDKPIADSFGEKVDVTHVIPNIGASNAFNAENTLEIDKLNNIQNIFRIYPNPVKGDINLTIAQDYQNAEVGVFDIMGKQVYSTLKESLRNNDRIKIPNNVKNGIYILKIRAKNKVQSQQFILYR